MRQLPQILIITIALLTAASHQQQHGDHQHTFTTRPPHPGSIDARLAPLAPAFNNSARHPLISATRDTPLLWHVSLFEPPAVLPPATDIYAPFAVGAVPICAAINDAGSRTRTVATVWELGAAILSAAAADAGPLAGLTLILVDDGPTNAAVRQALVDRGVVGLSGVVAGSNNTAWPAAAHANPRLRFVATEDEATAVLANTTGTMGFVPLAYGVGLPCAEMRVSNDTYAPVFSATLSGSGASQLRVVSTDGTTPRLRVTGDSYPFVGPLLISVRDGTSASCEAILASYAVGLSSDTSASAQAVFQSWNLVSLSHVAVLSELFRLVSLRGDECNSDLPIDVAGGSSAILEAAAAWSLFWPGAYDSFLHYPPVGSSTGHRLTQSGEQLAGTGDFPVAPEVTEQDPDFVSVPAVAYAAAVAFNLPGVDSLVIPRCLLPLLFMGNITHWDDPRIRAANPAVWIPRLPVRVTARAPGAGTTLVFTSGLADVVATCPDLDPDSIVPTKTWLLPTSEPLQPSTGDLASHVAATPGAIGYLSAGAAAQRNLPVAGIVDTTDNSVVLPTVESVSAALSVASLDTATGTVTLVPQSSTYPFIGITYLVLRKTHPHTANCTALRRVVEWARFGIASEEGRALSVSQNFAAVTPEMQALLLRLTDQMTCAGEYVLPRDADAGASEDNQAAVVSAAIIVSLILVILVGGAACLRTRSSSNSLAYAPLDDSKPFAVVFVGVANEAELNERYTEESMQAAFKQLSRLVRSAVKSAECYEAQRVSQGLFMIVASSTTAALECAERVANDVNVSAKWSLAPLDRKKTKDGSLPPTPRQTSGCPTPRQTSGSPTPQQTSKTPTPHQAPLQSGSSEETSSSRSRHDGLIVNVGVATGFGQIDHDAENKTVTYHGDVVGAAAKAADVCVPAMIAATETVVDAIHEDELEVNGSFDQLRHTNDATEGADVASHFFSYSPMGYAAASMVSQGLARRASKRHSSRLFAKSRNSEAGGGVTAAWMKKQTGIAEVRCAVVALHLPLLHDPATRGSPAFEQRAKTITADLHAISRIAAEHRCHVHEVHGTSVMVSANVTGITVTLPMVNATLFARAATSRLGPGVTAGVACGLVVAGAAHDMSVASSSVCRQAEAAACAATEMNLPCLCVVGAAGDQELVSRFSCATVDVLRLPSPDGEAGRTAVARLQAPVEEHDHSREEWLYNFSEAQGARDIESRWLAGCNQQSTSSDYEPRPDNAAKPPLAASSPTATSSSSGAKAPNDALAHATQVAEARLSLFEKDTSRYPAHRTVELLGLRGWALVRDE